MIISLKMKLCSEAMEAFLGLVVPCRAVPGRAVCLENHFLTVIINTRGCTRYIHPCHRQHKRRTGSRA